ncbi:MAG: protein BatD [Proteobacteria bacterium]|nr:protein BatD [Pseudomonadota bacterium]
MVKFAGRLLPNTLLTICTLLMATLAAAAGVTASVDRSSVDLNESFMLEIVADTNIKMEPDYSVLDEKFYRGQVSTLNNTSIINGQISQSRTWTITLMARATGNQEIPAISIGTETTQPLSIVINEPVNAPPGEADVFVTSEVDQSETYVQAQILYRLKVYRAVATRQPALRNGEITGVEVLVETVGDERAYEAVLDGKAYNVNERVVAIYPQESGQISITPARFEARVLRDGRITGRKVFESDAHTITVLPIPAPPADYPDAIWLPARDVVLSEEWSRDPTEISAGEPVTRHITTSALGQLETQIPALQPLVVEGLNVYADKPALSRRIEAGGIRGIRQDRYAIIGVRGGAIEIPPIEVPWWNIEVGEWRVARLPSRTIHVEAVDAPLAPPAAEPLVATAAEDEVHEALPSPVADGFWKRASQLLAAVWLLTIFAWWWSSRSTQTETREPAPPPVYKIQAKILHAARKAANNGDRAAVRSAIIKWGRLQWPDDAPRSVGEFASRVSSPLTEELRNLSSVSYGPADSDWDGQAMAKALRSISVLVEDDKVTEQDPLPPLMPSGT